MDTDGSTDTCTSLGDAKGETQGDTRTIHADNPNNTTSTIPAGHNENTDIATAKDATDTSLQRQSNINTNNSGENLNTLADNTGDGDRGVSEGIHTDSTSTKPLLSEITCSTPSNDTQTHSPAIMAGQTSASSATAADNINKQSLGELSEQIPSQQASPRDDDTPIHKPPSPPPPSAPSSNIPSDNIPEINEGLLAPVDDWFTAGDLNARGNSQPSPNDPTATHQNQPTQTTQKPSVGGTSSAAVLDGAARLPINGEELSASAAAAEGGGGAGGSGASPAEVVVVTGGSGFLGQHIVKLLQERAPHVAEIRVLDLKEFLQKLDYVPSKPVKSLVGSIADSKFVAQALRGAHSVIHVAGLISWGTFPDFAGMEEANVIGTVNVFNACVKNNVRRLVYCSTVDVAVGFQPITGGDEESTPAPPPDGFMFPGYPETKYQGERVILNPARVPRQEGENLQTVVLRANVLYGELDHAYVTNGLKMASQSKGVLRQIGDGMAMFQQAYVGNTAWAFVRADAAMRENPELTGEVFYVPDHTPVQNSFNFMRPYLEARGFRLSESRLSYTLVHSAVRVAEVLAKGLSPIYRLSLPVQSYSVAYINTSIYFSGEKAKKVLGYEPIFTPNEARHASLEYYKTVDLDKVED